MSSKSFVTMEQVVCPVCGKAHNTGALLLDKRGAKRFDRNTVTGWEMCPEHEKLKNDGYIALVGADPEKSTGTRLDQVWRTGAVAHLKADVWSDVFDTPVPEKGICFTTGEVIEILKKIQKRGAKSAP